MIGRVYENSLLEKEYQKKASSLVIDFEKNRTRYKLYSTAL